MATSFTSFVDSTNFFTLATFPNEVSIRDISRSLANCRLDPFDPSEMVARKEKESLASNIEHGVFRASRQADLSGNLCYIVDGVYFWPGLTERYTCGRKVVDATISRVLVKFLEGGNWRRNERAARSEWIECSRNAVNVWETRANELFLLFLRFRVHLWINLVRSFELIRSFFLRIFVRGIQWNLNEIFVTGIIEWIARVRKYWHSLKWSMCEKI